MSNLRKRLASKLEKEANKLPIIREIFKKEVEKICIETDVSYEEGALDAFLEHLSDEIDLFSLEEKISSSLKKLKEDIRENF